MLFSLIKFKIMGKLRYGSKLKFINSLKVSNIKILDIGCGNDSARKIKSIRDDIFYVGVDIDDYNLKNDSKKFMDVYEILNKEKFHEGLDAILRKNIFDALIWSHNIEHLNNFNATLECIVKRLRLGTKILISFPNIYSLSFPRRKGTLNFFDDPTHKI